MNDQYDEAMMKLINGLLGDAIFESLTHPDERDPFRAVIDQIAQHALGASRDVDEVGHPGIPPHSTCRRHRQPRLRRLQLSRDPRCSRQHR